MNQDNNNETGDFFEGFGITMRWMFLLGLIVWVAFFTNHWILAIGLFLLIAFIEYKNYQNLPDR